jgi:hypothetical protein
MRFKIVFLVAVTFWVTFHPLIYPPDARSFAGAGPVHGTTKAFLVDSVSGLQADQGPTSSKAASMEADLTPGQIHASEVLAYLLQITLGMAGDPEYRRQWRTRGLNEPLDFQNIVSIMTETERNALDVMVLDPNILDLTTVLYHYDKGLSLYEGDYGVTSIYPASEFIAIRLFLLKKIHSGEKVRLSGLMAREDLLHNPAVPPTEQDLQAMNLTPGEVKFLQEVIQSKPHLFQYLKSPFLVKALYDAGAVVEDGVVKEKISQAGFREYPCRHLQGSRLPNAVKICFIPSLTDEFVHGRSSDDPLADDFEPTDFLLEMVRKLVREIEAATKKCMGKKLVFSEDSDVAIGRSQWETFWTAIARKYIAFFVSDQRPFVIYPENAAQAVREICPQADFTVIILGRNVYKSIYFDRKADCYPAVNRIYLDIMDIKHSRTEEDVQPAACFISERIADRILAEQMRPE